MKYETKTIYEIFNIVPWIVYKTKLLLLMSCVERKYFRMCYKTGRVFKEIMSCP